MFAKNTNCEIFSWGKDVCGLLARGYKSRGYLIPQKIDFFDDKNIIDISCGAWHCLALSSDGVVYAWGDNRKGQIGKVHGEFISTPVEIDLKKEKIKLIHCTSFMSFAVSFNDTIYYWGQISDSSEILYQKVMLNESIKIKSLLKTFSDPIFSLQLYILSFDGIIYELCAEIINLKTVCDLNETEKQNSIIDLYIDSERRVVFETQESVYVYHNSKLENTFYKTLFEYLLFEKQKTYKTIHIKENQLFVLDFKSEENSEILTERHKKIYSTESSFKQLLNFKSNEIQSINYSFKQNESNFSLNKFRISKDLPRILESNVKYYYQSGSDSKFFGLFVMNDNRVFCFGDNEYGKLGLGHKDKIYDYTEIIELSYQNIQDFYEGEKCMFARNDKNEIFSWGINQYGELALGYMCEEGEYSEPEKISIFDGKNIIQISCGQSHCLAVSANGLIYGWGGNKFGQVGCGQGHDIISNPIQIDLKEKIKYIQCTRNMSFAISFDGNPYFWGKIDLIENFVFIPKLIPLKNVSKLYYFYSWEEFIILDNNGKVFLFNTLNEEINVIKSEEEFYDLYCDEDYCFLQTEDSVFKLEKQLNNDKNLIKTDFFDFYSQQSGNYKKTIEISKDGYLIEKQIQFNEKENILVLIDQLIFDKKYENDFEEISEIGGGSFGIVYNVKKRSNKVYYAIKMAEIKDELDLNEIKIMSKLNTDFVVQYIDSWVEGKVIFKRIKRFLFIQMEFCSMNLRDFIRYTNELFSDRFQTFNYFISCELLKELIECVNYLHSIPILHRQLKPENILISDGINGRFLKLCDFGLAKIHDKSIHTRMAGTMNYMAPEVKESNTYNTKSDIYSLALIGTEIFQFEDSVREIIILKTRENFDKYLSKYLNSILETKFIKLLDTLSNCLFAEDYHLRPNCEQMLKQINLSYVDKEISWNYEDILNLKSFYTQQIAKYNSTIQSNIKTYLETKEVQFYKKVHILEQTIKVLDKYCVSNFKYIKDIGRGGYGEVYMVEQNDKTFAIKQVEMKRDDFDDYFKEIRIMSKLDPKFVVKYINSWIEEEHHVNKFNRTNKVKKYLFIQMEICSQNLRKFIDSMKEISDQSFKIFSEFNYFISCELFLELIECLDYLHSIPEPDGPITHRDLNPNNILISDGNNGRFLKLCDFGLSKVYKNSYLSKMVSTQGYDPPEMWSSKYTPKSDIYSLAIIATEIFHFNDSIGKIRSHKKRDDFNKNLTKYTNTNLENKFSNLLDAIADCVTRGSDDYGLRPDCKELLKRNPGFSIDKSYLKETNIKDFESFLEKPEYLLLKIFFQTKISNLI